MKPHLKAEVWIVLGLSLGQSAVYAVVSLLEKMARGPVRESQASLNPSRSDLPWLDLTLQLLSIFFALVPVVLALYLLSRDHDAPPVFERLGLRGGSAVRDVLAGTGLAALIGLPGLGFYVVGRQLGLTADLVLAPEQLYAWSLALLVLSALKNAVLEEVIVVGYLMTRLGDSRWSAWTVIAVSALLRGAYHLYQGFGQALGNVIMGVIFAWCYQRTRRLWPLIVAHALIDIVAFVAYALFPDLVAKL